METSGNEKIRVYRMDGKECLQMKPEVRENEETWSMVDAGSYVLFYVRVILVQ